MEFSLWLVIWVVIILFVRGILARDGSNFWVYGSKEGTHEDTKGSPADPIIDIEAIQKSYGEFVQGPKHAWNKEIPDICDHAQGLTTSNAFRIKVKITPKEKDRIIRDFPDVTFAMVLFGRASTS